jgi:ketosteroid isomerase-like protein
VSANLDLVRSIYAEWVQGHFFNQDAWAHPDIEFEERDGPEPTHLKGIEALKKNFRDFMDAWAGRRVEAETYRELDQERVLVFARVSALGNASELPIAQPREAVYHLRDGRVARYVAYWDRARALAELGLED